MLYVIFSILCLYLKWSSWQQRLVHLHDRTGWAGGIMCMTPQYTIHYLYFMRYNWNVIHNRYYVLVVLSGVKMAMSVYVLLKVKNYWVSLHFVQTCINRRGYSGLTMMRLTFLLLIMMDWHKCPLQVELCSFALNCAICNPSSVFKIIILVFKIMSRCGWTVPVSNEPASLTPDKLEIIFTKQN